MRRVVMALNVPEDLAMHVAQAIEAYDGLNHAADEASEHAAETLYDLADTIRGAIHNTSEDDVAVTFTA